MPRTLVPDPGRATVYHRALQLMADRLVINDVHGFLRKVSLSLNSSAIYYSSRWRHNESHVLTGYGGFAAS